MNHHKFTAVLVASTLVGALSACTGTGEAGNPTTAGPTSDGSSTQTSPQLPQRPQELKLDGVDACKLLTEAQMAQLEVSTTTPINADLADVKDAPGCLYRKSVKYGYDLAPLATKGISHWLKGSGNVKVETTEVDGFGAVQITLIGVQDVDCTVSVDVAEGQQLWVKYDPRSTPEPQAQLCAKAKKAASMALATLKTLK